MVAGSSTVKVCTSMPLSCTSAGNCRFASRKLLRRRGDVDVGRELACHDARVGGSEEQVSPGHGRRQPEHRQPAAVPVRRRGLRTPQPGDRQPLALRGMGPLPTRPQHRRQPARPPPAPQRRRRHRRRELPHAPGPQPDRRPPLEALSASREGGSCWPPAGTASSPLTGRGLVCTGARLGADGRPPLTDPPTASRPTRTEHLR